MVIGGHLKVHLQVTTRQQLNMCNVPGIVDIKWRAVVSVFSVLLFSKVLYWI